MTVGSQACADALHSDRNHLPDGWTYIGGGISRRAYLCPHNVVYKITRRDWDANEAEWDHYLYWQERELPPGFVIPEMEMYYCGKDEEPIIAMEYIDGEPCRTICKNTTRPCNCKDCKMSRVFATLRTITDAFWDSVEDNVLLKDGIYYLVDIEC